MQFFSLIIYYIDQEEKDKSNEMLSSELKSLSSKLDDLQKENESLLAENSDLQTANEKLKQDLGTKSKSLQSALVIIIIKKKIINFFLKRRRNFQKFLLFLRKNLKL